MSLHSRWLSWGSIAKIIKTLSMESTVLNMYYVIDIVRLHVTLMRLDWQGQDQPWPSTSAGNIYCCRSCDVALPVLPFCKQGKARPETGYLHLHSNNTYWSTRFLDRTWSNVVVGLWWYHPKAHLPQVNCFVNTVLITWLSWRPAAYGMSTLNLLSWRP